MINYITTYIYVYFNAFYISIILRIFIFLYTFYLTGASQEIYHCDDYPSVENTTGDSYESTWYNNYQNRNYNNQYHTTHSDGTPLYEPYNEGLQPTSKGHRYELSNNERTVRFEEPERNLDQFTAELDGRPVYARYYYTDMQGQDHYSYSYDGSTMIGEIEPTKSEVIGNGYYRGSGNEWRIVDTSPTTTTRRIYNKVKTSIKNHIAKSNDEAIRQHNMNNKNYYEAVQRAKSMNRSRKTKHVNEMLSHHRDNSAFSKGVSIGSKSKKVRRFD